jgi:poly-gamma-glutamate capsule biosynthesis protein CapA/YwtB (metallophosphatase superfamily)
MRTKSARDRWGKLREKKIDLPLRPAHLVALLTILFATGPTPGQDANNGPNAVHTVPFLPEAEQLAMKIKEPFTVALVGDMLQLQPFSKRDNPNTQFLLNVMRSADMTMANNEDTIADWDAYMGPVSHAMAPATVADDWANMGIKMVNKASNLTWSAGQAGVIEDFRQLDRVGIAHAGVGRNETDARSAAYYVTPKGTVALVGVYADASQLNGRATGAAVVVTNEQLLELRAMRDSIVARRNEVENPIAVPPPDPEGQTSVFGLNFKTADAPSPPARIQSAEAAFSGDRSPETWKRDELHLTTYNGVTASQMAQLRAMVDDKGTGDTLTAWGIHFKVTPKTGDYSYAMNQEDLRAILREVKTGKEFSDFEVVTIHWHPNRYAFQEYSFDHEPSEAQIEFAHDVIDQGADAFFSHGVHTIKGVEVYKGKPIFYGLSNFVLQEDIFPSWRDRTGRDEPPLPANGPIVGEAEVDQSQWAWMAQPANLESLLVTGHYENGKLTEVRIYPVDDGETSRPYSQIGIPEKPPNDLANTILNQVIEYSKPFHTNIVIDNGVGIIRIPPGEQQ